MFSKIWNYFFKKKVVPIDMNIEIQKHPTSTEELLAIFSFEWPDDIDDATLISYYARFLFFLQNGHFYETILHAFAKKLDRWHPQDSDKLRDILHMEMQKLSQIVQIQNKPTGMEEHLRTPVVLPSDVFNFKAKIRDQQQGGHE
jgi:hypothetical protein